MINSASHFSVIIFMLSCTFSFLSLVSSTNYGLDYHQGYSIKKLLRPAGLSKGRILQGVKVKSLSLR